MRERSSISIGHDDISRKASGSEEQENCAAKSGYMLVALCYHDNLTIYLLKGNKEA